MIDDLKRYVPDYAKGNEHICDYFSEQQLYFAIKNSQLAEEECVKNKTDMPSTKVYQLVEELIKIKI